MEKVLECRYPIYGVVVDGAIYAACQKSSYIHCVDETGREQCCLSVPYIGCENLAVHTPFMHAKTHERSIHTTHYRDRGLRLGDLALNHVRFTIRGNYPHLPKRF
ncbi:hypothetical protein [uncultured Thermosynechococcus sp.]|uniref:hypothetical protein n=1 Tax=uncultured Thermosynechococcus sp. TaxID=436945 RepID=UPI00262B58C2|nr:hypothetical protein [uncultured Thermosynechococcus sp.]